MRNARSWRVSAREWNRYEDRARSGAAERRGAGFQPLAVLAQLGLLALMALASPSALWYAAVRGCRFMAGLARLALAIGRRAVAGAGFGWHS